jgi:Zn-dependent protease
VLGLSPEQLIANIIAVLIGMTVHEFAHNYVGYKMGDPVPRQLGRLTLNPLVHINWLGFAMFVLIGFGPLGSAPIAAHRMRADNRRWRWLAAVAAGPVSNLLLAIVVAFVIRISPVTLFSNDMLATIISTMLWINILLFVFNLLPFFPLDGWQIVYSLLPPDAARWWQQYQTYTYYALFGLILFGFVSDDLGIPSPLSLLILEPVLFLRRLLLGF